jgi:hypothetical protein
VLICNHAKQGKSDRLPRTFDLFGYFIRVVKWEASKVRHFERRFPHDTNQAIHGMAEQFHVGCDRTVSFCQTLF